MVVYSMDVTNIARIIVVDWNGMTLITKIVLDRSPCVGLCKPEIVKAVQITLIYHYQIGFLAGQVSKTNIIDQLTGSEIEEQGGVRENQRTGG